MCRPLVAFGSEPAGKGTRKQVHPEDCALPYAARNHAKWKRSMTPLAFQNMGTSPPTKFWVRRVLAEQWTPEWRRPFWCSIEL